MRSEQIARLLDGVDALLLPLGFSRRGREREWRKMVGDSTESWIHVNIGKAVVNPSVGVRYTDLSDVVPKAVSNVDGAMWMLGALFSPARTYLLAAGSETLREDLRSRGLWALDRLHDRSAVIAMLRSPSPADWPVPGSSWRARLLPLLLMARGQTAEALELGRGFLAEAPGRDQLRPVYEVFLDALARSGTSMGRG